MKHRLITTKNNGIIYCGLLDEKDRLVELHIEDPHKKSIIGNIYIGKVSNIVKGINVAFVNVGLEQDVFLQITKGNRYLYTNGKSPEDPLYIGDELLVQVTKEAYMKKAPTVTSGISITGECCVLTYNKCFSGISSKIKEPNERERLKEIFDQYVSGEYGFIIRTNAAYLEKERIVNEILALIKEYKALVESAKYKTCFSVLYEHPAIYTKLINDLYHKNIERYQFDDRKIFMECCDIFHGPKHELILKKFQYFEEEQYEFYRLYSFEQKINRAISERVYLKSGATIVIQRTEALTVIDVNSSKAQSKKGTEETIYKINEEAAVEVLRQLRLRNISGIIIVDFIDMKRSENKERLIKKLSRSAEFDRVKTTVIGMTALGLVEMTRKKVGVQLSEKIKQLREEQLRKED